MKKTVFLIVCCLLLCLTVAVCHPGRTDENGGHYDHSTGEYHYHHGFPAHQHTNGICPYDFVDQTGGESEGSSGVVRQEPTGDVPAISIPSFITGEETEEDGVDWWAVGLATVSILFLSPVGWLLLGVITGGICRFANRWRQRKMQAASKMRRATAHTPARRSTCSAPGQSQREVYRDLYEGKSIWKLAGVPAGVYFDAQDLPHTQECQCEEDPFVVWVTTNGESYHRPGCRMADGAAPVNICVAIRSGKCACKVCAPMERPPAFVEQYQRLRRIQQDYGIHLLP